MAPQSSVADKFNWFTSVIIWSVAFDLCAGRAQRPASNTKLQCDALINAFTGGRNESLKRWSPRCKQPHNQPWLTNWPCCRVHAQHHQHRQQLTCQPHLSRAPPLRSPTCPTLTIAVPATFAYPWAHSLWLIIFIFICVDTHHLRCDHQLRIELILHSTSRVFASSLSWGGSPE